ncbi:hypothetical protein GGR54DRAFT_620581 [Hypoxylon sp. NC1633]|nr:hypothetical protein GGR54DRAFT_620581 [Hypoxylon sp. NC1633]
MYQGLKRFWYMHYIYIYLGSQAARVTELTVYSGKRLAREKHALYHQHSAETKLLTKKERQANGLRNKYEKSSDNASLIRRAAERKPRKPHAIQPNVYCVDMSATSCGSTAEPKCQSNTFPGYPLTKGDIAMPKHGEDLLAGHLRTISHVHADGPSTAMVPWTSPWNSHVTDDSFLVHDGVGDYLTGRLLGQKAWWLSLGVESPASTYSSQVS